MTGLTASSTNNVPVISNGSDTNAGASAQQQRSFEPPTPIFDNTGGKKPHNKAPRVLKKSDNPAKYARFIDGTGYRYKPTYGTMKVPSISLSGFSWENKVYQNGWSLTKD